MSVRSQRTPLAAFLDQLQFWWSETNPMFGYFHDGVAQTMAPIPSFCPHRGVKSYLHPQHLRLYLPNDSGP